jgi:hypothetical protein
MVIQLKSISGFQNCFSAWSKNLNKHMQLLSRLNLHSHPHGNSPFLAIAIGGIAMSAGTSLTLEQAPKSKGTMMSINTFFGFLSVQLAHF